MASTSGRKALLKVSGAALAFTGEAFTTVSANTVYQITNTAKRVWDRTATITIKKDAVTQAASLYTLNRLTGTVTFLADIGGGHAITADGSYLPLSTAAQAKNYTYELSATNLNVAKFGDTFPSRIQGLKDVRGTASGWKTDTYFSDALIAGAPVVFEFWSDSTTTFDLRAWCLLSKEQVKTIIAGAISEDMTFEGTTDSDSRAISG